MFLGIYIYMTSFVSVSVHSFPGMSMRSGCHAAHNLMSVTIFEHVLIE